MSEPFNWEEMLGGIDFDNVFSDFFSDIQDAIGGGETDTGGDGGTGGDTNPPPPGGDGEEPPVADDDDFDEFDDIWQMLQFYLEDWGLESLAPHVKEWIIEGDSPELITLKLRETDAYKERFKGNELRRKKGLPVLSPAEYVEVERQYEEVLRRFGMPEGFYDGMDDFVKFIENDVSPLELTDRANIASNRYINADEEMRDQWERLGLGPGNAIAAMLDPDRALPILQRQMNTAAIAAEAQRAFQDRNRLSVDRAEEFARAGVTDDEARQAFGRLAGRQERDTWLSRLAGYDLSAEEQEDELLLGDEEAGRKRRRGVRAEEARFAGNYLAQETGFRKDTSGSY